MGSKRVHAEDCLGA